MKYGFRLIALGALLFLPLATPANAQYMFLDTNGDALHTLADTMNPNGTETVADVYLITNMNRDGSVAVCNSGDLELTINSYVVNLAASGGTVTYSFTNQQPTFTIVARPFVSTATNMVAGYAAGSPLSAGKYKLATVTITGVTGAPSIGIIPFSDLSPDPTSFGTLCFGLESDNTYKLGSDWQDADGIGAAAGGNASPQISAPATASGTEDVPILPITVTATDTDAADILTITQTGAPLDLILTTTPGVSPVTATLSGTPGANTQGPHTITWSVSDGVNVAVTTTTVLTIANADRAPIVTAPASVSGTVGNLITVEVTASDPDGEEIANLGAAPLPEGATFTLNATSAGTLTWTPTVSQTGVFNIVFTARNALTTSATTQITVTGGADQAPVVTAPAAVSGTEGTIINFTVTATDPNGDPITTLSGSPLPAGALFTPNGTNTSGSFSWTPGSTQAGSYAITWTASNALTGTGTTAITVADFDNPPVLAPISDVTVAEGATITANVSATDADGDLITLTASLPAFANLIAPTSGTGSVSTTIQISPTAGMAGTYPSSVTATANALTDTKTFTITVTGGGADQAPIVTAPATASGTETNLITIVVTASDPNGDPITSLVGAPLPTGAAFNANGTNTSGTFTWTPSSTQAGTYDVIFTASNALSGSATTHITVAKQPQDQPVSVAEIADVTVAEGSTITVNVTATDPDGDAITLTSSLPPFATLNAPTTGTGTVSTTITISPTAGDAGSYPSSVTASANGTTDTEPFTITVTGGGVNKAPVVTAPATQTVDEGQLLTFSVTATDPDGDHVTLVASGLPSGASFIDNGNNTGTFSWTPAFTQSGTHSVIFTGSDGNGGTGTATTTITVNNVPGGAAEATVFVTGGNKTTRLRTGKPFTCVQIEPVNNSFALGDVNLASITMSYLDQTINAVPGKTAPDGDTDHDGIEEIRACFSKSDLRQLFGDLEMGDHLVNVTVNGILNTGGSFQATFDHRVIAGNGNGHANLHAQAKPNPLNPRTELSFNLSKPGRVRIAIFDLNGRMVKTVLDDTQTAGEHFVSWDGTDSRGGRVASGVYYFQVKAPEGEVVERVTVLK